MRKRENILYVRTAFFIFLHFFKVYNDNKGKIIISFDRSFIDLLIHVGFVGICYFLRVKNNAER